jgi:hypothetical protein
MGPNAIEPHRNLAPTPACLGRLEFSSLTAFSLRRSFNFNGYDPDQHRAMEQAIVDHVAAGQN